MKKQLSNSVRLRLAAVLLFPLWGLGGLFAQVTVSNMDMDYTTKQASFTVSWTSAPHNNQIWVIVDYIKVAGATTVGSWSQATVTNPSATGNGSAAIYTGHRGFWLNTSGASGSANVTATLSIASGVEHFNWCAYALNTPPKAVLQADGTYKLQGTPPFTVNGTTLGAGVNTFGTGTCITSLGDATDNPTFIPPDAPVANTSNPAARCGAGAVTLSATASGGTTTAMTYTWIVGGGAAQQTTTGSLPLTSMAVGSTTYSVTVTNAAGCTGTAKTGTITLHTAVATASISGNASNTCPATSVALSATASGATTFTWYKNGTQVTTGTSSNYSATASGNYTVQGTNANCTGTTSAAKTVTISACGSVTGCNGLQLYQTTSSSDGSGNWRTADSYCTSNGARLPTLPELICMCSNRASLAGGYVTSNYYWSSTLTESFYHNVVYFVKSGCAANTSSENNIHQFRCVL